MSTDPEIRIVARTAACWYLAHADGPTQGDPYELSYGVPNFDTRRQAEEEAAKSRSNLTALQHDTPCLVLHCTGCGSAPDDGYHYASRQEAQQAAAPGCAGCDCPEETTQ